MNVVESYWGNRALLDGVKTAFLCSRQVSSIAVLRCYDWATEQWGRGGCVVSGFHSMMEKDVLSFLLRGHVPVVLVLGRRMYKQLPDDLATAMEEGRLLIISTSNAPRQSASTALVRNQYILDLADIIVLGSLNPSGSLATLLAPVRQQGKPIVVL